MTIALCDDEYANPGARRSGGRLELGMIVQGARAPAVHVHVPLAPERVSSQVSESICTEPFDTLTPPNTTMWFWRPSHVIPCWRRGVMPPVVVICVQVEPSYSQVSLVSPYVVAFRPSW